MQYQNKKLQRVFSLFTASGVGIVFYIFFSGIIIFLHQIPAIEQYLQIPRGFNIFRIITGWLDSLLVSTFGQSNTETLVVGVFWAFVGLGVYLFLQGVGRLINDVGEGMDERNYLWPKGVDRNYALRETIQKVVFRVLAFIGLMLVVFGPLTRMLQGPLWVDFIGPSLPLQLGVWFVIFCCTLHIAIILTRLLFLKPRLFD